MPSRSSAPQAANFPNLPCDQQNLTTGSIATTMSVGLTSNLLFTARSKIRRCQYEDERRYRDTNDTIHNLFSSRSILVLRTAI